MCEIRDLSGLKTYHCLEKAFPLDSCRYIFIIGGGGKTSLMFALTQRLQRLDQRIISSTTTKILLPSPQQSPKILFLKPPFSSSELCRISSSLEDFGHITLAHKSFRSSVGLKLQGFVPEQLDALHKARLADALIVEADGSAGLSLKAHAQHEPPISSIADLVVAVIGIDALEGKVNNSCIHRAERFCSLLDIAMEKEIEVEDIAKIFFHPEGYLKNVPASARLLVFLSKVKTQASQKKAKTLALELNRQDKDQRIHRIVYGDVYGSMKEY